MSEMEEIFQFMVDCLDEDEQLARAAANVEGSALTWHVSCRCPANKHVDTCRVCRIDGGIIIYDEGGHDEHQARHIVRHNPEQVLADIAAKRAILAEHEQVPADRCSAGDPETGCKTCHADTHCGEIEARGLCETVQHMAKAYAGRPGYKQSWQG